MVTNPAVSFAVNQQTTVPLPLSCGTVGAQFLVHATLNANLISPITLARQVGPVLLTESCGAVFPKQHEITIKAIKTALTITTVNHGVYMNFIYL